MMFRDNPRRWGRQGAGILFFCKDQILLLKRSEHVEEPGTWGTPGGAFGGDAYVDSEERFKTRTDLNEYWEAALEETEQELGSIPRSVFKTGEFDHVVFAEGNRRFVTFFVRISPQTRSKWDLVLNWENDEAEWFNVGDFPDPLHYGVKYIIDERPHIFGNYIPTKLLEFVKFPDALPGWAKELRVWVSGTIKIFNTNIDEWVDKPSYMISIASDLVKARNQYHNIYPLAGLAGRLGLKSGGLENAEYHGGGFNCFFELCDVVQNLAAQYAELEDDQLSCSIMPYEGSPWDFDQKQTYYFSSKLRKTVKSTPPPTKLIEQDPSTGKPGQKRVLDWCRVKPLISCSGIPNELGMIFPGDKNNEVYFASHCFNNLTEIRSALKDCGGLLMPSIGVGLVPSVNFGPFVLIADPLVVLEGLKPYRTGKGEFPVHVYKTDTWTVTTKGLYGDRGVEALEEWVGYDTGNQTDRFSLLLDWAGGRDMDDMPLRNTKQLLSRLQIIRRKWNYPDIELESIALSTDSKNYYPYIEAKVNGITPFKCYTAAFCPIDAADAFRKVLRRGGFAGSVYGIPGMHVEDVISPGGFSKMDRQEQWDAGWLVRRLLLGLIRKNPSRLHEVRYK
jgi:hypothetical protein